MGGTRTIVTLNQQIKTERLPPLSCGTLSSSNPANSDCSLARNAAAGSSSVFCAGGSLSKASNSDILKYQCDVNDRGVSKSIVTYFRIVPETRGPKICDALLLFILF